MRRKDREVKDFDDIISILEKCKVLHLALIFQGKPYAVQVNFGYNIVEIDGKKTLFVYFHGAGEGQKIDAINKNSTVSFCAESFSEVEENEIPCGWTTFYESVIGFGEATILSEKSEKTKAMDAIMFHNGYRLPAGVKFIAYNAMALAKTAVIQIKVNKITGKRHIK